MIRRLLLALALLFAAPAFAQQTISTLPQVATPTDPDLFVLDVQSYPFGQRTHSVSAAGIAAYITGKIPLGPQGVPGVQGLTGPANVLTIGTVTVGSPGSSPLVTISGTSPAQALNFTLPTGAAGPTGSAGPVGATGPAGSPGPQGAVGATGPPNVLSIGTVTSGDTGTPAAASISGVAPNQALSLTLPRGPVGATGPVGPTGSGQGNVLGPSGGSTSGDVAIYADATGTRLSDGGTLGTAAFKPLAFFLQSANNLSDLASVATARTNLGLGTAATQASSFFLQSANNLSDLANPGTARSNLALGTLATQNAASVAITGGTINGTAISGGTINGAPIGGTTTASGAFTTLTASTPIAVVSGGTGTGTSTGSGSVVLSASPALTGTPTAPTATAADSSTTLSTTAFVKAQGYTTASQAAAAAPVQSVAGRTGTVTLAVGDVSGAAPLASPTFTGTPAAPTPAAGDSSTKLATTGFVATSYAPLASPALTGTPTAPTAAAGTNTTQVATTAFVAASGGGGGAPSTINTQALPYTASAADKGKVINPTGTGALNLPAATATSGWYAYVKKRDDGGAATLTPASGTIDGLSLIVAYKEEFTVYYDAVASAAAGAPVYRTQGRQRGWIDFGSFTVTSGTSAVSITAGAGDGEIRDLDIDIENYVPSASTNLTLKAVQSSGSSTFNGEYVLGSAASTSSASMNATVSATIAAATTLSTSAEVILKNIGGALASQIRGRYDSVATSLLVSGGFVLPTAGALVSVSFAPSSGTITSMLYDVRLYRP